MLNKEKIIPDEVFSALVDEIVVINPLGRIVLVNDSWRNFTIENGISDGDKFSNDNYLDVCEKSARSDNLAREAMDGIRSVQNAQNDFFAMEYPCHSSTAQRWFHMHVAPISSRPGYVVISHSNITSRKYAEDSLNNSERKLRVEEKTRQNAVASERNKTQFLAKMSHEIRTPLSSILGYTSLLSLPEFSEKEKEAFVQSIELNCNQLNDLVGEILDLINVEGNRSKIEVKSILLPEEMRKIVSSILGTAQKKGLDLELVCQTSIPEYIRVDLKIFQRVLNNLLGNAIKFTDSGKVRVLLSFIQSKLSIKIEDTGVGIKDEDHDRVFNRLEQVDDSDKRKFGGIGIGLPLSRKLARNIGGDVKLVNSVWGKGSVFEFSLELEHIDSKLVDQVGLASEKKSQSNIPQKLQDAKILLVDDCSSLLSLYKRILSMAGASVVAVTNAEEAVNQFSTHPFDLIVMDVQMPGVDGLEATKILRGKGCELPIVALTASATKNDYTRCLESGFSGYLSKPVSYTKLVSTLAKLVNTPET